MLKTPTVSMPAMNRLVASKTWKTKVIVSKKLFMWAENQMCSC